MDIFLLCWKSETHKHTASICPHLSMRFLKEGMRETERLSLDGCLNHEMDLYFSLSAAFEAPADDCANTHTAISQSALT